MNTLISAENTWMLMAVMFGSVALTIFLEQKYVWGSRISGAVIVLIIAVCLTNFRIIPTSAPIFDDVVWGFAVPMAIPLLLLQSDLKKIMHETGPMLAIFLIGAAGTVAGVILGYELLKNAISGLAGVAAMMAGSSGVITFSSPRIGPFPPYLISIPILGSVSKKTSCMPEATGS